MAAYMDLSVPFDETDKLLPRLLTAQKLGYEVVAINNVITDLVTPSKKKKKKGQEKVEILAPESLKIDDSVLKKNGMVRCSQFKQLSRISTLLTDNAYMHRLEQAEVQRYDIVAVQPTTEKLFHSACKNLSVDIITIDVSQKLPFHIRRPAVNSAIERGVHFEIQYSPAIRDRGIRKFTIANALALMHICKGKNIILSGGCEKAIELRGPHDVANLGLLFNMNEAQCKDAVSKNCRAVLLHAECRRLTKSVVKAQEALSSGDRWLEKSCKPETSDDPPKLISAGDTTDVPKSSKTLLQVKHEESGISPVCVNNEESNDICKDVEIDNSHAVTENELRLGKRERTSEKLENELKHSVQNHTNNHRSDEPILKKQKLLDT